jgi:type I restriction enzyme M protein
VPPKSKGDYAFISHMIEAAVEKEGRVSVVVPHGILFRGSAEGRIREKLIKENLLDAVIGLPGNLFPSTSIPVAILIFDRSREKGGANESRKDVLFIDASQDYQPGKNHNTLLDEHMEKILNAYEKREKIEKYTHLASFDELQENDFNLNIPRYVDSFEEEAEIDIELVQQEIDTLEGELEEVRNKMTKLLKEVAT